MSQKTNYFEDMRLLIVITGGVSAYKTLDLIRLLKNSGATVNCIMTEAAENFVTPLSVSSISGEPVKKHLFASTNESEMDHIRLSREADLVIVAPATANFMAKMANGHADDLASAILLATDTPVVIAPAMNKQMWSHSATQRNLKTLLNDGIFVFGPDYGSLACGEIGPGRMLEPQALLERIENHFVSSVNYSLSGIKILVTSGPTHEAIDPVRYLGNISSGKQGHSIAKVLAQRGADVVLISGPTKELKPDGLTIRDVKSAQEMLAATEKELPVDIAICVAAVSDWRVAADSSTKIKKNGKSLELKLVENPDILSFLARSNSKRPKLVIGFAAETQKNKTKLIEIAEEKRIVKGCDWILANDVSSNTESLGGDLNTVHLITPAGNTSWPTIHKHKIAEKLAEQISEYISASVPAA